MTKGLCLPVTHILFLFVGDLRISLSFSLFFSLSLSYEMVILDLKSEVVCKIMCNTVKVDLTRNVDRGPSDSLLS